MGSSFIYLFFALKSWSLYYMGLLCCWSWVGKEIWGWGLLTWLLWFLLIAAGFYLNACIFLGSGDFV
jgi:hypothetical protein